MDIKLGRVEFSEINSSSIKKLYDYWKQKCAGREFPGIKDINIKDITEAVPCIYFTEIHYSPLRFYFTNVGSKVVEFEEADFNDRWLHDLVESEEWDSVDALLEVNSMKLALRTRVPVFGKEEMYWKEKFSTDFSAISQWGLFPLSDDNKNITHCITYTDYGDENE